VGEPIAVAFVEVLPETAAFKAQTEAQIRRQLAATQFAVPPSAGTAAQTGQLQALSTAAKETATAETLLTEAQERYNAALVAGQGVQGAAAKAHLQKAAAADADAVAQRALFAITDKTTAATVGEIDALVTATGALRAKAIAEERAAFATGQHAAFSSHASEAILAESATLTGLRGASLGVNPAFLAATAGAIAFFKSIEGAQDFEEQMHQIEFATHATGAELKQAQENAQAIGRSSEVFQASSLDAIEVIRETTESGQTLNEAYKETPAILNLATAAELEHADAVRTTVQLLDAYNLTAEQTTDVTDSIAIAGKSAAGSNEDFAQSLRVAAPVANAFGLSIRDTTTLLIQMVQGGVSASQAGSLLRQSLLRLTNPSNQAREALAKLEGGTFDFRKELFTTQGQLRPDAFERLAQALDGVDVQQQRNILTMIFSRRAVTGLLTLTGQQRASYQDTARAAHEYGVAQEEAEEKSRGLKGQTQELKDDASDLGIEFGKLTIGPLTAFVKNLRDITKGAGDAAFGIGLIGDAVGDLADKIPGGNRLFDLLKKAEGIQLLGPAGLIGRGISSIVGHFRRGDEESSKSLDHLKDTVARDMSAIADSVDQFGKKIGTGMQGVTRSLSLGGQLAIAQTTPGESDDLRILRERQAKQEADLARKRRLFASGDVNEAAVVNAANALDATNSAIASILSEQESKAQAAAADAKSKADKILQAQKDRDDALIAVISSEQTRREARVSAAGATEALGDDIKANDALRAFLRRSIADVQARIREARKAGRDTQALRSELQQLRLAKAAVRREIASLRSRRQEERDSSRVESAQLDVELATTGTSGLGEDRAQASINKEIRARQRLIRALKEAQSHVKRGTNEWKRLRNEIAAEQAAIAELRHQDTQKQQDLLAAKKQEFEFLQTIQGFTFNLLGNLIPGGATAGLVGGTTSNTGSQPLPIDRPGTRTTSVASSVRPVTTAQGNTQIDLLRKIHNELRADRKGHEHPEAAGQRRRGAAAYDYASGGTHGM